MERFDNWLLAVFTAIGGGIMWLIRQVLTNQKAIALLQSEIAHRDTLRQEDREAVREVRDDVKAIRREIGEMRGRE